MKKSLLLLLSVCFLGSSKAQNFTWVQGSSTSGVATVYGTMGTAATANTPGARHGCAKWMDAAGNLWLFGGEGTTGNWFGDLWKYTPSTNQWTWIRGANSFNATGTYGSLGVAAATNAPGAREFPSSWIDASGNFWMFGGDGFGSTSSFGRLNDLWKYDPVANQWTWMNGTNLVGQTAVYGTIGVPNAANTPGGRGGCGSWTDAGGNFWLFGGRGFASTSAMGYNNDLWKYNPSTNQWTWISGANTSGQLGNYGTMGTSAASNVPGGRFFCATWMGAGGVFYMMGGFGFAAPIAPPGQTINYLNDLWKYDPGTNQWTWVNGSTLVDQPGVYGTQGVTAANVMPGGRRASAYWNDIAGNFWLFGGRGISSSNPGTLNDLFKYNPTTNQWTWMKGSVLEDQNGTYGTLGVAAAANVPGAREYNTWWTSPNGTLWLYGAEGFDQSSSSEDNMSDLWRFATPCNPDSIVVLPGRNLCENQTATLTAVNGGTSTNWYTLQPNGSPIGTGATYVLVVQGISTSSAYPFYASIGTCSANPATAITLTLNPLPNLSATAQRTFICHGETVVITANGANTYTWNAGNTVSQSLTVSPNVNTTYTVTGTDVNGCVNTTTAVIKVSACTDIKATDIRKEISLFPNPGKGLFTVQSETALTEGRIIVLNALGQKVLEHALQAEQTQIQSDLAKGLYYYKITQGDKAYYTGKLIIE